MRLILIRHGASVHGERGIIASGSGCGGLTELGFQQADLLAQRLRTAPDVAHGCVLLSSPALRAYQTAAALAGVIASGAVIKDNDLTEIKTGDAEGLTWDAYQAQYGAFDLPAEPTRPFAPGGESWQQYIERVRTALERLAQTYADQTVLVTTHAGFIVATMLVIFDIPRTRRGWLDPAHTSMTEWGVDSERWTLVRYNDATHLISAGH